MVIMTALRYRLSGGDIEKAGIAAESHRIPARGATGVPAPSPRPRGPLAIGLHRAPANPAPLAK
jgi:hypothetical protein